MKMILAVALLFAAPAHAAAIDEFIACVVGQSAVVLHIQGQKDPYEALEIAYDMCPNPEGMDEATITYVNLMVERMAAE